jgi:hypothetical protein
MVCKVWDRRITSAIGRAITCIREWFDEDLDVVNERGRRGDGPWAHT